MRERNRFERELEVLALQDFDQQQPAKQQPAKPPPPPFPVVASNNRTIFVADTGPFKTLPQKARTSAIAELTRLYGFVGAAQNQKAMTVKLLEPSKFPEVFAFSDAVVAMTKSSADLQAHLDEAIRIQIANAAFSLSQHGVTFSNPFAATPRTPIKPERTGLGRRDKIIRSARAFPFMASVVALDELMAEFVTEAESKVHLSKVRKRRATLDAKYWGSHRALIETAILSVIDNSKDPSKWLWDLELFGHLIGRAMAHEVRHVYIGDTHAADGLGADSPPLNVTSSKAFSTTDQRAMLQAIQALENTQGQNPIVPTFPSGRRTAFPF